jgi:hypothetical protein
VDFGWDYCTSTLSRTASYAGAARVLAPTGTPGQSSPQTGGPRPRRRGHHHAQLLDVEQTEVVGAVIGDGPVEDVGGSASLGRGGSCGQARFLSPSGHDLLDATDQPVNEVRSLYMPLIAIDGEEAS